MPLAAMWCAQEDMMADNSDNSGWRFSAMFGIMYGNIPVGIILLAIVAAILFATGVLP